MILENSHDRLARLKNELEKTLNKRQELLDFAEYYSASDLSDSALQWLEQSYNLEKILRFEINKLKSLTV